MHWEQRLGEMIMAGGALIAAACSPSHDVGLCNNFDDPCRGPCGEWLMTPACEQEMECLARGASIAASDYDQSCSVDSDCVGITEGTFCGQGCYEVNAAINVADEQKYQSDLSSTMADETACPDPWPAACYAGTCAMAFARPSADAEVDAAVDANADAATDAAADASTE